MHDLARDMGRAFSVLLFLAFVSVPLGLWKLVEIVIWLVNHVEVTFVD